MRCRPQRRRQRDGPFVGQGTARYFRLLFLTGKALVNLGRLDISVKWLGRAAALDPSYPEPRYVLAHTYRRLGRAADAS
jgi:Flp pilus assembly protein TadD